MKKVLLALSLVLLAGSASAQHWHHGHRPYVYHGGYHNHNHNNNGWIAPLIIGGVVGAVIASRPATQPETVIVQSQPVIVQQQNCSLWIETQNPDGTITRTRTCTQ